MNRRIRPGDSSGWVQHHFFVLLGVLFAALFWIGESLLHFYFFEPGNLSHDLFPTVYHEMWMRMFIVCMFLGFGFFTQRIDDARMRAEIRRGEEQFKALMDVSPEAIAVHQGGLWVYANDAAAKLFGGKQPEDIIGRQVMEFVHPDDHIVVQERMRQLFEGEALTPKLEERLLQPGGTSILAEVYALRTEFDGKPAVMVVARDIDERRRAELELQRSELRLKEAQRVAHLGSWELDLLENSLWWSDENYRIFGVEPGSVNTYDTFLATVHPDDKVYVDRAYTASVKNRTPYNIEHRLLLPDGLVKWVNERCETYYHDDGTPLRSAGTTLDITESRHSADVIRLSQERFATIFRQAPLGMALIDSLNGTIHELNPRFAEIAGRSVEEMKAVDWMSITHPEDVQADLDNMALMNAGRIPGFTMEKRYFRPDRSIVWVRMTIAPLRGEKGSSPQHLCMIEDITERKQADEALRESKDLLRSIIEHAPIRVFWKDAQSRYLGCNSAFAHDAGLTQPEELIGKSDFDMGWREQAELYRTDDHRVMASGEAKLGFEEPQTTPEGRHIWLRTSKVPLRSAAGELFGLLGIYEDITQRKEAELELLQANRALRTISACNSVLVHARDETNLLQEMCRVIVKTGGYLMAWVGIAEHDAGKSVRPVGQSGYEEGYLDSVNITWADMERGRGPTGTAIRTGKKVVNQDCLNNPKMAPWREQAIKRGYQSSIALPLAISKAEMAVLTIYAAEPDAFNLDEVALLEELASDLAYGIGALRTRVAHKEAEDRLDFMAHHDALTGMPNRILLHDRFEQVAATARRRGSNVAMLFLNLDDFHLVNDVLGRSLADHMLVQVVERLHGCIRESDTISREGGDEFIILLGDVGDLAAIEIIVQKILDAFSEPFTVDDHIVSVTSSIGISIFPNDGRDFNRLISQSEAALHKAKAAGKDTYNFFTEQMNINALEHMQLQGQLRHAISNQEFRIYYQPQIDMLNERMIGAEALVRWQHPQHGLVPPLKFIPLAERSGLIIPLGEWVLNEACRQAQVWRKRNRMPSMVMAVNLSAVQFKRGNIVETVIQALERSGLPAENLELELTESILLDDVEVVMETLHRLKDIGIKLSIDDFGTGYSSLSYLKRLAVDKLKIDQSFVRDMVVDPEDAAIVSAIIQLGHTLQLTVIAEGVETRAQLQLLKSLECNEVQGYLFSRPIPAEDFSGLFEQAGESGMNDKA